MELDTATPRRVHVVNFGDQQASGGGLTDAELRANPVPVSGFPATQPVSGTVSVGNFPASQAVTGTFFQAVQPTEDRPRAHTVRVGAIVVAPAANAVIADSGAVTGEYDVEIHMGSTGVAAVGKGMAVEHRNAANNANVWTYTVPTPGTATYTSRRLTFATNERIRVVNAPTAGEASSRYSAVIVLRPVL